MGALQDQLDPSSTVPGSQAVTFDDVTGESDTTNHGQSHESGGVDEINVTDLLGVLANNQNPTVHASTHENGGSDELDVTGLSGPLADEQTPVDHEHTNGAGDGGNIPSSSVLFNGASETVEEILDDTLNNGILDAITLSDDGGLNVSWSTGEVYDQSQATPVIETDAGSDTCTDNAVNFLVYKPGSKLETYTPIRIRRVFYPKRRHTSPTV
jgi:hypothetical protein